MKPGASPVRRKRLARWSLPIRVRDLFLESYDESLLNVAVAATREDPDGAELPVASLWRSVARNPRWKRWRVTPQNAEQRLRDFRAGLRYGPHGDRFHSRRTRRLLRSALRELSPNDPAHGELAASMVALAPPPDWDDSVTS